MEPQSIYQRPEVMRAYADRLLGEVEEFMEEVCIGALSMEGGRRSIEEALDLLQTSHASYGAPDAALGNIAEKVSTAIPVVAERVAVPKKAGLVNPADWLPPDRRAVFEDLPSLRRPELQWRSVVAACHRVSQAEEARLVERLMKSDMVTLLPESVFPRDSRGRLMLGGFFCVGKNEKEDRLIFDRRPENATMERLRWAKLPAGACFCRVLLEPHEFLRGSGDDLRNYYYTLQLPSNWIRYNGVGRRVAPELVAKFGGDPSIPHRMALRVLGMGDTNACDIAQGMHEHLLQSVGLLSKETKLIYGQHVPRGPLLEGVYLDDLLVVAKVACAHQVPIDGTFVPPLAQATDVDVDHCARAERAYAAAGLERAVHKSFRCATSFKAWGAEVDGVTGRVGAPKSVRQQVWTLLWRVILGGATTKGVLQPTDATPTAGGATVANVPPALAQELWRHSDVRGEAVRLDSGEACSSAAEEPRQPSVFASSVATVVQWEVQSSYSFKQTSHINLQEARALKKEIVAIASDPKAAGTIQICLNDSRVVIGAASKGRSSSFKLNGILRTMLPFLIFGDISLALLWGDERNAEVRLGNRLWRLGEKCCSDFIVGGVEAQSGRRVFFDWQRSKAAPSGEPRGWTEDLGSSIPRFLNAVYAVKPGWKAEVNSKEAPAPVEPLPLRALPLNKATRWYHNLSQVGTFLQSYWRTVCGTLLLLCFPRILAALVALVIRLMIRALAATSMRILQEVWSEFGGVVQQLASMTSAVEQLMVQNLERLLGGPLAPAEHPPVAVGLGGPETSLDIEAQAFAEDVTRSWEDIEGLSKYHDKNPYAFGDGPPLQYDPAEDRATTIIMGGNSNWRGPVWFPINYLLIESLQKFHQYYGDDYLVEFPTGSGQKARLEDAKNSWLAQMNILKIADELSERLIKIFERDQDGYRPGMNLHPKMKEDHFHENILFYEYFHGDNGRGVGSSHQTGWTGLVAKLPLWHC
ncbi:Uncharacterized protein YMR196W [Durusdinium trenchii]|uniref:Uncharacterized protein YMR196W n=1 Tax=Durusdinium trenchii TaxID=1381693 RepID=A0ABP0MQV7_9DINO